MSFGVKANRLVKESSPYLLQHAYNPVDWHPWGEEAFESAKRLDRPIFLSIGYSSCHWCHVMEGECFEDDEVAELMNSSFVNIKVDREERPDIDGVYMKACQLMTGSGGWPLSIIMTPEKRPFYAATFIPKISRQGILGMLDIVPTIVRTWNERRGNIDQVAGKVTEALQNVVTGRGVGKLEELEHKAFEGLSDGYEDEYGGFEIEPKFPTPHRIMFLYRYSREHHDHKSVKEANWTLRCMALGGIHDHVGGGFHRYSTDRRWFLPHFEKMLYDQAMISIAYIDGFLATREGMFKDAAISTLEYVMRDLSDPAGGFYSSEDADGKEGEGAFYTWTLDEIETAVGREDAHMFIELFGVRKEGNYKEVVGSGYSGRNVLHMDEDLETYARRRYVQKEKLDSSIANCIGLLFRTRESRERPRLDDKILLDWNGLMIAALARAGRSFGQKRFIDRAESAVSFIESKMVTPEGRVFHRFRDGQVGIDAFLTDHSFYCWGLIELHQATLDKRYLDLACKYTDRMNALFEDRAGGFFTSISDDLIAREKDVYDGAIPSGNSVALYVNTLLAYLTGEERFREVSRRTAERFGGEVGSVPETHIFFILGTQIMLNGASVVRMNPNEEIGSIATARSVIDGSYAPEVLMIREDRAEWKHGNAIAQVCMANACLAPVEDIDSLRKQLVI